METLSNPAATQGADYGGLLSDILKNYTQISLARINNESARYQAAAQIQQQTFNAPQSTGGLLDALNIGNAVIPGTNSAGVATTKQLNVGRIALLLGLGVAGVFVVKKLLR